MKSTAKLTSASKTKLILLIGIPLLLVLSLVLLFGKSKTTPAEQLPAEEEQVQEQDQENASEQTSEFPEMLPQEPEARQAAIDERLQEIINFSPVNPKIVVAKASNEPNADILNSDTPYSYLNPVFEWSGAQVKEEGVNITGYMVYFGESHYAPDFQREAKFQESNTYQAQGLENGKTYYLMVRVMTDSQNMTRALGFDFDGEPRVVRPIFTYVYE